MATKPRCTGKTKKGTRCKAAPLKGTDHCLAHSDAKIRESVGFVPDNGKAGRKPLPKPTDIARKLIEENELALQRPYWRTLGYDVVIGENGPELVALQEGGAKLHGESRDGDIKVSDAEDLGAMITAAEKLQDRVYGRPKQVAEISGPEGGPVELNLPVDAQARSARAAALLAQHGQLDDGD